MSATQLANRYDLQEMIGKGGMGTVYRALDHQTGTTVAVKTLHYDLLTFEPDVLERFKQEGEALRQLNHPNIVKMLDAFKHEDNHYLIMEYISGGDVKSLLQRGQIPVERTVQIALDIADALTRAHRLDIIHRDLKPANILIASDGNSRLTDFGVAQMAKAEAVGQQDVMVGTVEYLAPEALRGAPVDRRADIWAFGVTLFEMLTGKPPFCGEALSMLITAILTQPLPDLQQMRPETPPALVDLIYRMLDKDPLSRIGSVRQIGLELEALVEGTPVTPNGRFTSTDIIVFQTNLPSPTTPFIGREAELETLIRQMNEPSTRLITLLAPGGMGKTRLSIELGYQLLDQFHDGVYFIELAPLNAVEQILPAIAETLDYRFVSDNRTPHQQLIDYLREKQILLIMDNCEHLIEGSSLFAAILHAAPAVKIVATSRQRLNQTGETVQILSGMEFPEWETPEDALEYNAVKLFMQSAKRARTDFELHSDDLQYIARICRLVQGLPLGILLAAAWVAMLSPQEIAQEMQQNLDFLENNITDLPVRQRSIRAVFNYTWNLLTPDEQQAFMRLSIFRGDFAREAAQEVTGADLRTLMALMNKSLLQRSPTTGRYSVHELLRQYAEEHLTHSGENDTLRNAHCHYYMQLTALRVKAFWSNFNLQTMNAIESEMNNITAAWHHAVDWQRLDLFADVLDIHHYFDSRAQWREGLALFRPVEQILPPNDSLIKAKLFGCISTLFSRLNEVEQSRHYADEAWRMAQALDAPPQFAYMALIGMHMRRVLSREFEASLAMMEQELPKFSGLGIMERGIRFNIAYLAWRLGDRTRAIRNFEELLDMETGPYAKVMILNNLASAMNAIGEYDKALAYYEHNIPLARSLKQNLVLGLSLNGIMQALMYNGDHQTALKYSQEALTIWKNLGNRFYISRGYAITGDIYITQKDVKNAAAYFHQALKNAVDLQSHDGVVIMMSRYARLKMMEGSPLQGAELIGMIHAHPLTGEGDFGILLTSIESDLQSILSPETYQAALEQGKTFDLWNTVRQLLNEYQS